MSDGKKEILLGDCLDLMKTIDDNSIDLVFTDWSRDKTHFKTDWQFFLKHKATYKQR